MIVSYRLAVIDPLLWTTTAPTSPTTSQSFAKRMKLFYIHSLPTPLTSCSRWTENPSIHGRTVGEASRYGYEEFGKREFFAALPEIRKLTFKEAEVCFSFLPIVPRYEFEILSILTRYVPRLREEVSDIWPRLFSLTKRELKAVAAIS